MKIRNRIVLLLSSGFLHLLRVSQGQHWLRSIYVLHDIVMSTGESMSSIPVTISQLPIIKRFGSFVVNVSSQLLGQTLFEPQYQLVNVLDFIKSMDIENSI